MLATDTQENRTSPAPIAYPCPPSGGEPAGDSSWAEQHALIRRAQRGDSAAFEELVRRYDKALLRLALHLTGSENDAQDVCQEALLRAYQNLASFRFECSFHTWIYRIVTNRCLDYLRRRHRHGRDAGTIVFPDGGEAEGLDRVADGRRGNNPESGVVGRELRTRIARALEKLSPRERLVFELKHYHDLRLRAVAVILNTSEGNARHTLFRATHKLRSALAGVR